MSFIVIASNFIGFAGTGVLKLSVFSDFTKMFAMLSYPVRIALIAALGGFLFGFETVVISGAEQTLEKLWHLNKLTQGLTVASSLFGTILGSLLAAVPAQKYGRKKSLQTIAILFIVAAL